jgi:hypothetical protein
MYQIGPSRPLSRRLLRRSHILHSLTIHTERQVSKKRKVYWKDEEDADIYEQTTQLHFPLAHREASARQTKFGLTPDNEVSRSGLMLVSALAASIRAAYRGVV